MISGSTFTYSWITYKHMTHRAIPDEDHFTLSFNSLKFAKLLISSYPKLKPLKAGFWYMVSRRKRFPHIQLQTLFYTDPLLLTFVCCRQQMLRALIMISTRSWPGPRTLRWLSAAKTDAPTMTQKGSTYSWMTNDLSIQSLAWNVVMVIHSGRMSTNQTTVYVFQVPICIAQKCLRRFVSAWFCCMRYSFGPHVCVI